MDLQNLVEKITREVMETMEQKGHTAVTAPSAPSMKFSKNGGGALLLVGSPMAEPSLIQQAVSYLSSLGMSVTAAVNGAVQHGGFDGAVSIRCVSMSDCAQALRNSSKVIYLLCGIEPLARLAGLMAGRFDVASVIAAMDAGCEVMALDSMGSVPAPLKAKVESMIREIESYGIKVIKFTPSARSSAPSWAAPSAASPVQCSATSGGDCAGCGLCVSLAKDQVKMVLNEGADRVSASSGVGGIDTALARMIDHTLLKPDATRDQVLKLCQEAREYTFASCCVNPTWVPTVAEALKGSPVKTCVVIGFPLGANSTVVKSMETRDAIAAGADEVDMVINVGALKAGDYELVQKDIEAVVQAAQGRIVKVILETALLNDEEKVKACQLSKQAGADFVKTSTGFGPGGATVEDIALMRKTVGKYMGVKASGGIRDQAQAKAMVNAGATRIGASASIAIVRGDAVKAGKGY